MTPYNSYQRPKHYLESPLPNPNIFDSVPPEAISSREPNDFFYIPLKDIVIPKPYKAKPKGSELQRVRPDLFELSVKSPIEKRKMSRRPAQTVRDVLIYRKDFSEKQMEEVIFQFDNKNITKGSTSKERWTPRQIMYMLKILRKTKGMNLSWDGISQKFTKKFNVERAPYIMYNYYLVYWKDNMPNSFFEGKGTRIDFLRDRVKIYTAGESPDQWNFYREFKRHTRGA